MPHSNAQDRRLTSRPKNFSISSQRKRDRGQKPPPPPTSARRVPSPAPKAARTGWDKAARTPRGGGRAREDPRPKPPDAHRDRLLDCEPPVKTTAGSRTPDPGHPAGKKPRNPQQPEAGSTPFRIRSGADDEHRARRTHTRPALARRCVRGARGRPGSSPARPAFRLLCSLRSRHLGNPEPASHLHPRPPPPRDSQLRSCLFKWWGQRAAPAAAAWVAPRATIEGRTKMAAALAR